MRTDTIFYHLFPTLNSLLFELLGQLPGNAEGYQFTSAEVAEVKEKAFRFDGIFMPENEDQPIFLWKSNFKKNQLFIGN